MMQFEKPHQRGTGTANSSRHDWIVAHIADSGLYESITIFGQATVDDALREARVSLGPDAQIAMVATVDAIIGSIPHERSSNETAER